MTDNMHSQADSAFAICLINNGKCQTDAAMLWHFNSSTQWHSWHIENDRPLSKRFEFSPSLCPLCDSIAQVSIHYVPITSLYAVLTNSWPSLFSYAFSSQNCFTFFHYDFRESAFLFSSNNLLNTGQLHSFPTRSATQLVSGN